MSKMASLKLFKVASIILLSLIILHTARAEESEERANPPVSFALTLDLDAQDETVECDEDSEDAFDEWIDNNGGAIVSGFCGTVDWDWDFVDQGDVSFCGNTETFVVTFTATDDCDGASVSTTATFTIQDTTPPTPPAAPADLTLDCADNIPVPPTLTAYDECDGVDIAGIVSETDNGGTSCVIITRTWTFTDECGNASTSTQTITVIDNTAPVIITQAQDQTIECDEDSEDAFDEWIDNNGGAIAIDNCGNVEWDWELVDQGDVSFCGNTETFIVTFTASDDCGNEASTTATFTIEDTTPPTPPAPPANVTLACIDDVTMPVDLLATDECSDDDILGVVTETNNGATGCVGNPLIITRTWTFTDECGNASTSTQTITVIDNTAPVIITQAQNQTIECDEDSEDAFDEWIDNNGGAIAIDNCGNVEWDWELVDQGDVSFCGNTETFIVTFTASDDCGNEASTTATFTIEDTTPPTPPAPPANVTLACIDDVTMPVDLLATDECSDGDILGVVTETNNGATGCVGNPLIITRTWTFTDECGNASTSTQTITVIDNTAPAIITQAQDQTIECDEDSEDAFDEWIDNNGGAVAIDNCGNVEWDWELVDQGDVSFCGNTETFIVTFTASDDCGNEASTTATFTIEDTTPPTPPAPPANVTLACIDDVTMPVDLLATDECSDDDILGVVTEINNGATGCVGNPLIITRTWTFTDECGNASTSTQTITVIDNTAPVIITQAQDQTIECDEDSEDAFDEWIDNNGGAIAIDNCGNVEWDWELVDQGDVSFCGNTETFIVTFTASDDCGNEASTTATFTIEDTTPPTPPAPPANVTLACIDDVTMPVDLLATDECSDDDILGVVTETNNGATGCVGNPLIITRTWTFTDECGNASTSTQTITIIDDVNPVITAPADVTIACNESDLPTNTGQATATDNCDTDVTVTYADTVTPGVCANESNITRTWTATDDCGNTATAVQIISIIDNTAPVLLSPAQDITVECDEDSEDAFDNWIDLNGLAAAADLCGPVTWSFDITDPGDVSFCGNTEVIEVTFTATDACNNAISTTATFTIEDTTPPTPPAPPANVTLACIDDVSMPVDLLATDECSDDDILGVVTETNNGATGCVGNPLIITRTWTFTDECGNASTSTQTITVIDDVNPVITAPADVTIACNESDLPTNTGQATATDNCDTDVDVTYADTVTPGVCDNESNITRTWTATDDCGNTATAVQIISIIDNTAPVLLSPAQDITVECDEDSEDAFDNWIDLNGLAAAADLCGPVTWSFDITDPGDVSFCGNTEVIEVTFTATDACNNAISTTATFTIEDTTPPTPPAPPANVTLACIDDVTMPVDLLATDECSDDDILGVVTETNNGATGCVGNPLIITRTWTFTDECGNASTSTQTITVIDDVNPVITAPADVTIACNESDLPTNTGQATATDNCDTDIDVTYADTVTPGVCANESNITRTWTATDDCGNTATAVQIISIIDNTAPVLLSPAQDITVECDEDSEDAFDNWIDLNGLAAAADLCGPVTWTFDITDPGDVSFCGNTEVIEVTFTATDACNNAISTTATFTIEDTTPPTPPAPPANVTLACIDDVIYAR